MCSSVQADAEGASVRFLAQVGCSFWKTKDLSVGWQLPDHLVFNEQVGIRWEVPGGVTTCTDGYNG
jgi:hypothetical protein